MLGRRMEKLSGCTDNEVAHKILGLQASGHKLHELIIQKCSHIIIS